MDKREAILEAALRLFAERGFHGTSVAMIAESAHVGAGTIYRYFQDKEELVNVLFQQWKRKFSDSLLIDLPVDLPPRLLFHELWKRMGAFAQEHFDALMFLEFHHHAPYLDDTSRELIDSLHAAFYDFLEKLSSLQITKEVPADLLLAIFTGVYIGYQKSVASGMLQATPELDAQAEEICWEAIRR